MSELILHHFDLSPFAAKARLMLGLKKQPWQSVEIPMVMPKPDLTALTGGYRKTPVLQIGAEGDAPGLADIHAYFPLWMARANIPTAAHILAPLARTAAWEE